MLIHILVTFLSLICCTYAVIPAPLPCCPTGNSTQGFTAKFYEYPFQDYNTYKSDEYLTGGYKDLYYFGEKTGITNINIHNASFSRTVVQGELYGFPVSISNFTIEFSGYFVPPMSGNYIFQSFSENTAVMFGAGEAFTCYPDGPGDGSYLIYTYFGYSNWTTTATRDLTAGQAYPIKIVWTNPRSPYSINFAVEIPDLTVISIFDNVYTYEDADAICFPNPTKTVTSTWTNEETSLSTSLYSGIGTDIVKIYVPITTTVEQWLESYITTYTTNTVITESGSTVSEDIVVVETPEATITTTQGGSGIFATTYTTETVISGSGNVQNTDILVVVETPTQTLTTTIPWSGSGAVTITTYTILASTIPTPSVVYYYTEVGNTLVYGSSTAIVNADVEYTEPLIIIETPMATLTTTKDGSGVLATTYTTDTIIIGSGSVEETDFLVVVETPTQTLTTTIPWSSDYTSSFTTQTVLTTTVVATIIQPIIGYIDEIPVTTSLTTFITSEEIIYTEPLVVVETPVINSESLSAVSSTYSSSMSTSNTVVENSSTQDSSIATVTSFISLDISSIQESSSGSSFVASNESSTQSSSSESSLISSMVSSTQSSPGGPNFVSSNEPSTQRSSSGSSLISLIGSSSQDSGSRSSVNFNLITSGTSSYSLPFSENSVGTTSNRPSSNSSSTSKPTSTSEEPSQSFFSKSHSSNIPSSELSSQSSSEFSSDFRNSKTSIESSPKYSSELISMSSQVVTISTSSDITSSFGPSSFNFKNSTQGTLTLTSTNTQTTVVTITSCSDNLCVLTTVSATPKLITATENGQTTIYTTYCPIPPSNDVATTTVVTIISCSNKKCFETTVLGSRILTSQIINGETTTYTTHIPLYKTPAINVILNKSGERQTISNNQLTLLNSAEPSENSYLPGEYGEETMSSAIPILFSTTSQSTSISEANQSSTISEFQGSGSITNPLFFLLLIPFSIFF